MRFRLRFAGFATGTHTEGILKPCASASPTQPDPALFDRRIDGAELRDLADAYGVAPSTLSRYFRSPEGQRGLSAAESRRHDGGTGATRANVAPSAPEAGPPAAQIRQSGGRAIPADYVGPLVVRGEDAFVFPLERGGEVLSQWPGVRNVGLDGFRETLALMVEKNDLIMDTDHSPTYPLAVEGGGRRRFVVVRESRTAGDVARLGRIRRYDAAGKGEQRPGYQVPEVEIDITDKDGLRRAITTTARKIYSADPPGRRSGAWNPNAHLLEMAVRTE